jgi:hypothetical protein
LFLTEPASKSFHLLRTVLFNDAFRANWTHNSESFRMYFMRFRHCIGHPDTWYRTPRTPPPRFEQLIYSSHFSLGPLLLCIRFLYNLTWHSRREKAFCYTKLAWDGRSHNQFEIHWVTVFNRHIPLVSPLYKDLSVFLKSFSFQILLMLP